MKKRPSEIFVMPCGAEYLRSELIDEASRLRFDVLIQHVNSCTVCASIYDRARAGESDAVDRAHLRRLFRLNLL